MRLRSTPLKKTKKTEAQLNLKFLISCFFLEKPQLYHYSKRERHPLIRIRMPAMLSKKCDGEFIFAGILSLPFDETLNR